MLHLIHFREERVNRRLRAVTAAALLLVTSAVIGAERWVTDELRINLRSGAGNQYRIVKILETGAPLETLETAGEWTRVRLPEGGTGWVRTQYVTDRPVAASRLEQAQTQLAQARERVSELESELERTRAALATARSEADALEGRNEELAAQVEAAEEGLKLSDENARLAETVSGLRDRIGELEGEASRLADTRERQWFMIGAGVLFAGLLSGIVVTRIPWRRRRDRLF